MKSIFFITSLVTAGAVDPVGKVLDLLKQLYDTVAKDGEVEQKEYEVFAEWLSDQARKHQYEVKTGKAQRANLKATIEKASGDISTHNARIQELTANIGANEADLSSATSIRDKEHGTFKKEEHELVETVDTLNRAHQVLSRQFKQGGSFAQLPQAMKDLTNSLQVIISASMFSTTDASQLKAFLQQTQEGVNAPEAAKYESQSHGILDTLEDLLEKAQGALADTRKAEVERRHAYELLAQSLRDELRVQQEALSETRKQLAAVTEVKATAEGDLATTVKDLAEDEAYLRDLKRNGQQRATDWDFSLKSRAEELNALREARRIIAEATGGAARRQYKEFIQVAGKTRSTRVVYDEVETAIKKLAKTEASSVARNFALTQLAGQIKSAVTMNADPFAKVKGLITDMISRLVQQAQEEASHKAFCDKETADNEKKRNKLQAEARKLGTRIERATAGVAKLKEEIGDLNTALSNIAASQKKLDEMRQDEHSEWVKAKADFEQGLLGIRNALKILREYYADQGESAALLQAAVPATSVHAKSGDSATGIISILEVAESDFARSIAEGQNAEDDATEVYNETTQENKVSTATKRANVEGKTQESARLQALITDATSDRDGVQVELSAVLEYLEKLRPQCTTEPESYEDRKARREHEIEGLKDALEILENETAFTQVGEKGESFMAVRRHTS